MRLFSNKQLRLRVIAAIAESILFYIGFLYANQIAGGSGINIVFFLITALCGLFTNSLPYNSSDKHKNTLVTGSIGLALVILSIGISAKGDFNLFALPIGFIALVFLYNRSYTGYLASILYVYTAESFYQSAVFLFIINAAVAFGSRSFNLISEEFMRYSVLYIIMALYMLSEIKNFRYISKNENSNRTAFDITATSFMVLITVVMSVPKIFKLAIFPFTKAFYFIYGWVVKAILLITYPIARLLNYIYDLIVLPDQPGKPKPDYNNMLERRTNMRKP
ncbi:MAG: hypothetical protein A2Y23_10075 [Clostridiales bacterium GWB2_37_7]|nr:MAG: hypothetical protein A2Y23_10075 [Clostridiales bacterium GWB2_37_7]